MKQVSAIVIGAGARGQVYAKYAAEHPDRLRILAVAEPKQDRRELFCRAYGIPPELAVASNAVGGVTGKMISPQSISVATSATNMVGQEGNLFRFALGHSIALTLILCVLAYCQAGFLSWMLP